MHGDQLLACIVMLPALLAGEKLDARAAIAGRYISQEPVTNTSATASTSNSTSSRQSSTGQRPYWESGLFDKDSWIEAQSGWACSVVTGRARLGGMPCGKQILLSLERGTVPGSVWQSHGLVQKLG